MTPHPSARAGRARRPRLRPSAALVPLLLASPALAQSWTFLGPAPVSFLGDSAGRLSAVAPSRANPDTYFVAGADGGVWRTTDAGQSWTPLTDHMPTPAMGALAIDPTNEDIIYAGTGEANFANHSRHGLGLYKSTDGGDTWEHLAAETFSGRCFSRIVIDPTNPATLYASITRAGGFPEMAAARSHPDRAGPLGVFKSTDAGRTWTRLPGIPDVSTTDLAIDPATPTTLYAAVGHIFGNAANGLYKSADAGASWTRLGGGLPQTGVGRVALAVAPSNPRRLYTIFVNPATSTGGSASTLGVFRSDDAGASWTQVPAGSFQATYGWYLCVVGVHPTNPDAVLVGGLDMRRSTNAGASWQTVTPPHVDIHAITFDAAGRLLSGDDGGLHRSPNLGDDWVSLNDGLGTMQFYAGLSTHPTNPDFLIGGFQDNGTNRRTTSTIAWQNVAGGDGGWTQVNQSNPSIVFAESQGTGALYRSTNGGASFNGAGSGISGGDRNCFLPPYLIDPITPSRVLYATHRIYESTTGGAGGWTPVSVDLTGGGGAAIRSLAMSPSDPRVTYAATNDGRVLVSTDSARTFRVILTGNPGWPRVTRELFVHPTDPRTVYLATSAFNTTQLRRSTDQGQTWRPLDAGLPDIPVNTVAADVRRSPPALYAGTDAGLYRSLDDGASWHFYGVGLPRCAVIDILLDPVRERLILGTQGRGSWLAPINGCYADCDVSTGVGTLDIFDFLCFQNAYDSGALYADCDQSTGAGVLDIFDFLCFQNAFASGACP